MPKHVKTKQYKIPLGLSLLSMGGMFLFTYLTFIPEQTFAADIVDPAEKRSLSNIEYMQNMNQQICINSRENETRQLRDVRDGKLYWVAKLKDGNCWMTQNMDYDGGGTAKAISAWPSSNNSSDNKYYNNPGDYVYTYSEHGQKASDYCNNVQSFDSGANCTNLYTEVTPSNQSTLDMHYHVGNFYTYDATINGVCPTGWQLPTSNTTGDGSFGALMNAYGISDSTNLSKLYSDTYPLRFVYGGFLNSGSLNSAGDSGRYWSSTPGGSDGSHFLYFDSSVNPSNYSRRFLGYSVRCLAMGGWLDSYPDPNSEANVAITVAPVISIDVTSDAIVEEMDFTTVARTTIEARVGTNQGYKVLISAEEDATDLKSTKQDNIQVIPMISTDSTILPRTRAWGIKKLGIVSTSTGNSNNNDELITIPTSDGEGTGISVEVNKDTIYSPVGTPNSPETFYTSDTAAATTLIFPVAIAVDSTTPFGTYSTQVTLTAVVN